MSNIYKTMYYTLMTLGVISIVIMIDLAYYLITTTLIQVG